MRILKFLILVSIFLFTYSLTAIFNLLISPLHEAGHLMVASLLGVAPQTISWGSVSFQNLVFPQYHLIGVAGGLFAGLCLIPVYFLYKWGFSKIKTKYEDIGDFFDEALKPLRVDIRQQCQRLALSRADFITKFLQQAVPQNPKVAEEAMTHIRQKVNPRFEGVQYTLSENPLVILNLVDFLYVRIYYISGH